MHVAWKREWTNRSLWGEALDTQSFSHFSMTLTTAVRSASEILLWCSSTLDDTSTRMSAYAFTGHSTECVPPTSASSCASSVSQPALCRRHHGLPRRGFPCHHVQVSSHTYWLCSRGGHEEEESVTWGSSVRLIGVFIGTQTFSVPTSSC